MDEAQAHQIVFHYWILGIVLQAGWWYVLYMGVAVIRMIPFLGGRQSDY